MVMVPASSHQYSFLASELDKGEWLAPHTGYLTPAEQTPVSAEQENMWAIGLDNLLKRQFFSMVGN
jgi:hypothetical protein